MSLPVVIVTSGGLPVTVATNGLGTPMVAAATGLAVTFAASGGLPVVGISSGPPAAPVNTVAPFIVGTPAVGQTLTAATGSWTGSPAPSYTYQWKRGGVNIGGATASTYLLVSADLAAMMTVTVTATNSQGNASATSAAVGPVAAGVVAPVNTVLPTIDDTTPTEGQMLTATTGTWTGTPTPTYAYQWIRTAFVAVLPVNTVAPAVTGTTSVGSTLTTTNGTWTGTPAPTFTRQWKRGGTTNIGSGALTYTLVAGDSGTNITCVVTATNTAGAVDATSNSVGPITSGDADVTAWKADVITAGGTVSGARQTALDTFVTSLKSAGVWTKLDRYWLLAGENTQSATIDLKARVAATVTGTPVFTANKGWVTSISNNVDTGFTPSTAGGSYQLNSAMFGGFVNTNRLTETTTIEYGCANAAFTIVAAFQGYTAGSWGLAKINDGSASFGTDKNHGTRGCWTITRGASNAVAMYYNGSSAGYPNGGFSGSSVVGASMPDAPFAIGGLNQGGSFVAHSGDQISSFYCGGFLTSAEALALYNAETALMTSIAVLP